MKFIYQAILARIASQLSDIKYVDLDKGQFEMERPPVSFPACLVSMQITGASENQKTSLHKQLLVTLRIGCNFFGNTSSITPTPDRDASLAYLDLVDDIEKAFQGWDDGTRRFNYFTLVSMREERRPDIKVMNIAFRTSFHDDAT